jgi:hypothetical protein
MEHPDYGFDALSGADLLKAPLERSYYPVLSDTTTISTGALLRSHGVPVHTRFISSESPLTND